MGCKRLRSSNSRIHVMHVIDTLERGGAERMLVEIANQCARDGHRVSVCVSRSGVNLARELAPAILLYVLNRRSRWDMTGFSRFSSLLKAQMPDALHVHGRASFSFLLIAKFAGLALPPIILHDHNGLIDMDDTAPFWFRFFGKDNLAGYVGVCDELAGWAQKCGVAARKIHVIENALDLRRIREAPAVNMRVALNIPHNKLLGIMAGAIRRHKGLDNLIRAVKRSDFAKQVVFLIVGEKQDIVFFDECQDLIRRLDLSDSFIFLDEGLDAVPMMRGVDFSVSSSISESGPLVLIEYLTLGLSFVATRTGSVGRWSFQAGVPGIVPPNDPVAFSSALNDLLSLDQRGRTLRGETGRDIAGEYFEIRQRMPAWYDLYQKVIDTAPHGVGVKLKR